jgi:putative ABC transport system permease protein
MTSDREPSARRYRRFFGVDPTRDADDELAFHLTMRIEEFKRAGLNEHQAREAAMHRFGNYNAIQSEMHEIDARVHARHRRAWNLDALRQDIRFAARTLFAQPAYTLAVAVTMALGIGANTAVFSVVYGVILRPLPFRDANQLVRLWSRNDARHLEFFSVSPAD